MSIVISRPIIKNEKKPATKITYDWAEDIVQSMCLGGLEVYDLGNNVTRNQVEQILQIPDVEMFIHYGHGTDESLLGSHSIPILDDDNLSLLTDKIVVCINCESADNFGENAVAAGAKSFLGYAEKVYLRYNNKGQSYTGFKEANNAWNTVRLNGDLVSAGQAFNQIGKTYQYWIDVYNQNDFPEISECMEKSMEALLILGDETEYLPAQIPVEQIPYKPIYPVRYRWL